MTLRRTMAEAVYNGLKIYALRARRGSIAKVSTRASPSIPDNEKNEETEESAAA